MSKTAICSDLADETDALTLALVDDGGPKSQAAGVALISGLDGACGY